MVDRELPVTDDELHAYVDGELPPERRKTVEGWLATHPDDAARVAAWRAHAELIRVRYGAVAAVRPPIALTRLTANRSASARRCAWRSEHGPLDTTSIQ